MAAPELLTVPEAVPRHWWLCMSELTNSVGIACDTQCDSCAVKEVRIDLRRLSGVRCVATLASGDLCLQPAVTPAGTVQPLEPTCIRHIRPAVRAMRDAADELARERGWVPREEFYEAVGRAMTEAADGRRRRATKGSRVYYATRGDWRNGALIKIGRSVNIRERMRDLDARCLTSHPGHSTEEKALHKQFAHHRSHGEWFRPSPDLVRHIEDVAAEHGWEGEDE